MSSAYASALVTRNFAAAIKCLDVEITQVSNSDTSAVCQLICNRAYCYEELQLNRRALKVRPTCAKCRCCLSVSISTHMHVLQEYEEAVKISTAHNAPFVLAFVRQGLLLYKLKKGNVSSAGHCRLVLQRKGV